MNFFTAAATLHLSTDLTLVVVNPYEEVTPVYYEKEGYMVPADTNSESTKVSFSALRSGTIVRFTTNIGDFTQGEIIGGTVNFDIVKEVVIVNYRIKTPFGVHYVDERKILY